MSDLDFPRLDEEREKCREFLLNYASNTQASEQPYLIQLVSKAIT